MKRAVRWFRVSWLVFVLLVVQSACGTSLELSAERTSPPEAMQKTPQASVTRLTSQGEGELKVTPTAVEGSATVVPVTAQLFERRLMVVEWPKAIRVGDADVVRFSVVMDQEGKITPTAEISGHPVEGEPVEIPNLYETHNLVVVARLDMAGMQISPAGETRQPLRPGKSITFYWSLSPTQPGEYRGTLWAFLNLVPKSGGAVEEQPLMIRRLEIEGRSVLGVPARVARWGGAVGTVISGVLGFPFLEQILKLWWQWARRKRV